MAARVVQKNKEKTHNYLLMHAMGPNVAGVIGSAIVFAGVLLAFFPTQKHLLSKNQKKRNLLSDFFA